MNERLAELFGQAGISDSINEEFGIEYLAELIVKECLSHVKDRHLCDEIRNSLGIVDEAER